MLFDSETLGQQQETAIVGNRRQRVAPELVVENNRRVVQKRAVDTMLVTELLTNLAELVERNRGYKPVFARKVTRLAQHGFPLEPRRRDVGLGRAIPLHGNGLR